MVKKNNIKIVLQKEKNEMWNQMEYKESAVQNLFRSKKIKMIKKIHRIL